MLGEVLFGLFLILVLVFSSGVAVDVFEKIAHEVKINKLLLATFLVSFSTSLPEFSVGIVSALKGEPQIALGNLIGANLANLSWIVGGAAVIAGVIPVIGDYLKKDLWMTIGMAMFPFFLMSDGKLGRVDGVILILIYFFYAKKMVKAADVLKHSKLRKNKKTHWKIKNVGGWVFHFVVLLGSLALMVISSHYLINTALHLTSKLGVSAYWVGLMIISLGTTLPELVLSLFASKKGDVSLLLGNILGSVVVNSTFIMGIIALISPIIFESSVQKGLSGLFLIIILGLFWLFTKSKRKLERWEGLTLIGIYLMFVGLQFLVA
jgi:cation:H+ antiporter